MHIITHFKTFHHFCFIFSASLCLWYPCAGGCGLCLFSVHVYSVNLTSSTHFIIVLSLFYQMQLKYVFVSLVKTMLKNAVALIETFHSLVFFWGCFGTDLLNLRIALLWTVLLNLRIALLWSLKFSLAWLIFSRVKTHSQRQFSCLISAYSLKY